MQRGCRAVVTGGAGFIGSHLVEELLNRECSVTVVDDFSAGTMENLRHLVKNAALTIVREDLKNPKSLDAVVKGHDLIFHLAANPEVRLGQTEPKVHFEENVLVTFNLLEAVRRAGKGKVLVFTSTSTVYGEASRMPTPEDYGPLIPISTYGASKLASEALMTSYAHTFGHRALILRFANIVGPKSNHGVIVDFVKKLRANSAELEILGDGTQKKSYMYITDLVGAVVHLAGSFLESDDTNAIYNVGTEDSVTVKEIAAIVISEMNLQEVLFEFTGGVDGGRGWRGDVKNMCLSTEKLLGTGWKPRYSSREAVRLAARKIIRALRAD